MTKCNLPNYFWFIGSLLIDKDKFFTRYFCRMPNENLPVCPCGVVVDLPKSRNSSIVLEKLTILLPKSKRNKQEGKSSRKQQDDRRELKTRASCEIGSSSSATESAKPTMKSSKHKKRFDHSRRTRSADSAESHYTYIGQLVCILCTSLYYNFAKFFFALHVYFLVVRFRKITFKNKFNFFLSN